MFLETRRLIIRDLLPADSLAFAQMAADGSLRDIGFDPNCSSWITAWQEEAAALAIQDDPKRDYLAYTVVLKDSLIPIGAVGCSYYEDLQQTGITYFIGAPYRSNGYALEAVEAYLDYFSSHYPIQTLIGTVRAENIPSWQVLEKAGFRLTAKKQYRDINDTQEELYHFYERVFPKKLP